MFRPLRPEQEELVVRKLGPAILSEYKDLYHQRMNTLATLPVDDEFAEHRNNRLKALWKEFLHII